jgi:hypothetical protein
MVVRVLGEKFAGEIVAASAARTVQSSERRAHFEVAFLSRF